MNKKILLKIASFFPIIYLPLFFIISLSLLVYALITGNQSNGTIIVESIAGVGLFGILLPLHLLAMLDIPFLYIYYLINVFKNNRVPQDKKALWFLLILFGNIIVYPFYWSRFIKESNFPRNLAKSVTVK